MATYAPGPQEAVPHEVDERIWRMPVERYHEMVQSGALGADDRTKGCWLKRGRRQVLEPSQELLFSLDGELLGRVALSQILPP